MKNLILISQQFPGPNQEPFLEIEYSFLSKRFINIYYHNLAPVNNEKQIKLEPFNAKLRYILFKNFWFLIKLWVYTLWTEPKRLYYVKNWKKFFNIWIGWLREAAAWEKALLKFNPKDTVIYTYWYENQAMPLTILRAKGKLPFKWVSRAHGWDVDENQRKEKIIPFRHWMLKNPPNKIVSISNFGKDIFYNKYGFKADVAYLGTPKMEKDVKSNDQKIFSIVSISSLIPLKRIHLIVNILKQCDFDVHWTHFGNGPEYKKIPWDELPNNIKLNFKGHCNHQDLLSYLKSNHFNLMLHVSQFEGIPVSIMECMSLNIPVIACNTGGVNEIVNNDNGWLIPVDFEPKEVGKLLLNAKNNPNTLEEKASKAYSTWQSKFNADVNFPNFIDAYLA